MSPVSSPADLLQSRLNISFIHMLKSVFLGSCAIVWRLECCKYTTLRELLPSSWTSLCRAHPSCHLSQIRGQEGVWAQLGYVRPRCYQSDAIKMHLWILPTSVSHSLFSISLEAWWSRQHLAQQARSLVKWQIVWL